MRLVTVSPTHLRWSHKPNCEEILRNKGLANPSMFFCTSFVIFLKSHDGFSFLLHHWDGFFHLEVLWRFLLLYVELLTRGWDGVLWDGAIFYVSRKVPVAVDGDGPQAGSEVQGQRAPCRHICDAGVRHHGSIAVCVAAAPGFSLEVQSECPPTPWLLDFCLDLQSDQNENKTSCFNFYYK